MKPTILININHREVGRDYSLGGQCEVQETKAVSAIASIATEATVYIHANDIRANSDARKQVLAKASVCKWRVVLFTNSEARTAAVDDLPENTVFSWTEISKSYPRLPLLGQPVYVGALSILCQGYQASQARIHSRISERKRNDTKRSEWWRDTLSEMSMKELLIALNIEFEGRIPKEVRTLVEWMFDATSRGEDISKIAGDALGKLRARDLPAEPI